MSKITNDVLTRSGTGCCIAVPIWQQWASKGWRSTVLCGPLAGSKKSRTRLPLLRRDILRLKSCWWWCCVLQRFVTWSGSACPFDRATGLLWKRSSDTRGCRRTTSWPHDCSELIAVLTVALSSSGVRLLLMSSPQCRVVHGGPLRRRLHLFIRPIPCHAWTVATHFVVDR